VLSFLFSFLLIATSTGATESRGALPINFSLESNIGPRLKQQLPTLLHTALMVVKMFPPQGYENNLFHWSMSRQILAGKTLTFTYAKTTTPWIAKMLADSHSDNMDAFTLAPISIENKSMAILVVLLLDKIFYDGNGREYENGFSRLILALAHEIYGNVQHFLQLDIESARPQTMEDRVNLERRAFRASLLFLDGVKESDKYSSLPEGVRNGLLALLPAEVRAFESWLEAHPLRIPDPACTAILDSVSKKNPKE
jgi:hypothetical protein